MPRLPASSANIHLDRRIRRGEPGSEDAVFPRFVEESAIFTFQARPLGLNWSDGLMVAQSFTSPLGVAVIGDAPVVHSALRYYHAISGEHDDVTARNLMLSIRDNITGTLVGIANLQSVPQGQLVFVVRPIVVGENHHIRLTASAVAAGFTVTLRTYSSNQGLGAELPGL